MQNQATGSRVLGEAFCILHSSFFIQMPGRLISRTSPFEGERGGASPSPAANFRSVVKQDHIWPTPRNRRGSTFPGDHLPLSVEVCTPVSETGRTGALPAAAANLIHADFNKE